MSEYWKSTPKYWCKNCSTYVVDTKLGRANHEATAKHQSGVKRALRELHRGAEREEHEKERARREIERLEGVVSGTGAGARHNGAAAAAVREPQKVTQEDRHRQLEQLADLGVNIPDQLRGDMAMAGEWTVTTTRVIDDTDRDGSAEGKTTGSRKRELEKTEEEREEEEAMQNLFKKPKKWGRDSRLLPAADDAELDALLNGTLPRPVKKEEVKKEEESGDGLPVKTEEEDGNAADGEEKPVVKQEPEDIGSVPKDEPALASVPDAKPVDTATAEAPAVVFKKRKPKNIRQK